MAFLAALLAFGSRFASKVLTTTLGWASTLLFGRVPGSRQIMLLVITFGSVIWMVMLAGVIFPDIGAFLLLLIPQQEIIPEWVIRLAMLLGVAIVPAIVGALTLMLTDADSRPTGRARLEAIARGYPLTVLLAVLLVFLALLAVVRKGRSLAKRWTDAHVPMVVEPGRYDDVAADLDKALSDAGLDLASSAAPKTMSLPAQWLAKVAGRSSATLVPDRMLQLQGPDLDILIYPMDVLISGKPASVTRARAAIASRLTTSAAHLTVTAEAQAVEDRLAALGNGSRDEPDTAPRFDAAAAAEFASIDEALSTIEVSYEEWEVLYRQRLQVERDLRAGAMAGESVLGSGDLADDGGRLDLSGIGRLLRQGANAVADAITDDSTIETLDKLAGPRWRLVAQAADVAVVAARAAVEGATTDDPDEASADDKAESATATEAAAGEPARFDTTDADDDQEPRALP